MRLTALFSIAAASAALLPAAAQTRAPQARVFTLGNDGPAEHRAALGVSTRSTGSLRDTLGLLVSAVTKGGPAERAGLEEGNRIAAINGVSLRASVADIEDDELAGTLSRRLIRELAKAKPGDEVDLRVYRDGRTTAVRVRTANADSVFRRRDPMTFTRAGMDDRPMLGVSVTSTGNRRDTLGVFVTSVADSTPAARAGVEEGNRIAAINGVSLRVATEDASDRYLGGIKAQRLQREIAQLTPGSDVTLRVYANGQFRDVHMKVARAGDLPRDRSRTMIMGGNGFEGFDGGPMAPFPPMRLQAPQRIRMRLRDPVPPAGASGVQVLPEIRRQMEIVRHEMELVEPALENIGPVLERLRPELERIRTEVPRAVRQAREAARLGEVTSNE